MVWTPAVSKTGDTASGLDTYSKAGHRLVVWTPAVRLDTG